MTAEERSHAAPEDHPHGQVPEPSVCATLGARHMADYRRVTAIVRLDRLGRVVKALQDLHVSGVSISRVKGYGEYADLFAHDWMSPYARIEIFTSSEHAAQVSDAVLGAASTGTRGDGIVAVEAIESVLRIRSGSPIPPGEI